MANEPEGVAQPMPEEITLSGKPPKKNITEADNLNGLPKQTLVTNSDFYNEPFTFKETERTYAIWWRLVSRLGSEIMTCRMDSRQISSQLPATKEIPKNPSEIHGIRQRSDESLRDYLGRFGKETLHMTDWSDEMMTGAFISGLRSTDEANTENRLRDSKWINSDNRHGVNHKDPSRKQKERFVSHPNTRPSDHSNNHKPSFTPLIKSPADIFATSASRIFTPGHHRDRTKYCDFHNDHGHDTNDFVDLRKEIEACVRSGRLSHLAKGAKTHNNNQTPTSFLPSDKEKNQIEWKRQDGKHKEANEILMTSVQ
ncbi:reverse transcriptase domain-containing protein [Artemisia annua]|uniref:Reverse transcriptase domain-containing protein n=1 Tax=Artemisia annua TaxID=35608 RepID=A0A2U1LVA9_ARTAN|nr:reverse transcriptase domain-containing protein [Artemisia annua]